MFENLVETISSIIHLNNATLRVYDATLDFEEPTEYASVYPLAFVPNSPFKTFENAKVLNEEFKTFRYSSLSTIPLRVDFRGQNAYENLHKFKNALHLDAFYLLLKERKTGFNGVGRETLLNTPNTVKNLVGYSVVVTLNVSELFEADYKLIKEIPVKTKQIKEQ